jgi:hypothetical protein
MEGREGLIDRILAYGAEFGLLITFLFLMLVELGYVVWLEKLPALPVLDHSSNEFILLPPWYDHPRAEITLLLSVSGAAIAWAGIGLLKLACASQEDSTRRDMKRSVTERLRVAGFWAILAGADLLFIQLLRA